MARSPRVQQHGLLPDGRPVEALVIGSEPGPVVEIVTLGAAVNRLEVADADGVRRNVVLGHGDAADRWSSTAYLGAIVGRYANRIAGGRFELDGREVVLGTNDRGNTLHGGPEGFDHRLWTVVEHAPDELALSLVSPDGDQGFPGELTAEVRYRVVGDSLRIELRATTDAPTVVNLTNHAYFNLDGEGAGAIDGHLMRLDADEYTPVDDTGVPLGPLESVEGTPFDFREPTRLGPRVRGHHPQLLSARGIDHNVVVRGDGLRTCALLESPDTGIRLEVRSDRPGLQVYTGNQLDGTQPSTTGGRYRQGDGIALEAQLFPDSPHHPGWPSPVLRPGDTYAATVEWAFSAGPRTSSSAG